MRNQKADIAGILLGLMLLAGLGQTYGPAAPLGFDMADNPFNPYHTWNPTTDFSTATCYSNDPCDSYDFIPSIGGGTGTCSWYTMDTDGDSIPAYENTFNAGDWTNIDAGCISLQDWDQDGTCDHRVYDEDRDQVMTDYQPTDVYYTYIGLGFWAPSVGPSICTGWVGV